MALVEPYPSGVVKIDKMLNVTSFFPGGQGIWKEDHSTIDPVVMVLGHDFSTVKKFIEMTNSNMSDIDSPTWRNMIKLFISSGIDLNECFFTNAFMGLRNTESMVGVFPGFKDKEFVERNIAFLKYQIELIKPKVIITLGKYAAQFLTECTADLETWKNEKALKAKNEGLVHDVRFNAHVCNCVALEHPSMRNSNVRRREYNGFKGNDAEVEMLRAAFVDFRTE